MKNFLFKHIEKFILGIAACYLIYTISHTFIIVNLKTHKINRELLSLSSIIDRRLKTSAPQPIDTERKEATQLESRLTTPPPVNFLLRSQVFSKFTRGETISGITTEDLSKKQEPQTLRSLEVTAPGDTEFTFKGGTADLALIQVRKFYKDTWWTESFPAEKGKTIGLKKILGKETVDFDTHCKLIEIISYAQKPLVIKKTVVLRNGKGEFLGTSLTGETHMVTTSRIVFENKKGESYNLWIGELVNLGTETVTIHPSTNTSSTN